jgi:hypothetical protein
VWNASADLNANFSADIGQSLLVRNLGSLVIVMGMAVNHKPSDKKQATFPKDWGVYFSMRWWKNHYEISEGIAYMRNRAGGDPLWNSLTVEAVKQLEQVVMTMECLEPAPCVCPRCFE